MSVETQKPNIQRTLEGISQVKEYAQAGVVLPPVQTQEEIAALEEERHATLAALQEIMDGLISPDVADLLLAGKAQVDIISLHRGRSWSNRQRASGVIDGLDPDRREALSLDVVDIILEGGQRPHLQFSLVRVLSLNQYYTQHPTERDKPGYVTDLIQRKFPTEKEEPSWDFNVSSTIVGVVSSSRKHTIHATKEILPKDLLVFPRLVPLFLSGVESLTSRTVKAIKELPDPNVEIARARQVAMAMNESVKAMKAVSSTPDHSFGK